MSTNALARAKQSHFYFQTVPLLANMELTFPAYEVKFSLQGYYSGMLKHLKDKPKE